MATINPIYFEIVKTIFSNWTALKLAVEHDMGTIQQAQAFCEYITEFLSTKNQLHYTDIAAELEDYMDAEFDTTLEDNSHDEVAQELYKFYVSVNNAQPVEAEMQRLPTLQPWLTENKVYTPQLQQIDETDVDDSTVKSNMEVDSDGFALVRRKKK